MNNNLNLNTIKNNLHEINNNILLNNNVAVSPTIIAVSKNQNTDAIVNAINCGVANFAENYVQEAYEKWYNIKQQYPFVKLHLIGSLQTNKVNKALELFNCIHTIDNIKLADKIALNSLAKQKEFFIQINLDSNKQSGCEPNTLHNLLAHCKSLNLNIVGLMGILPAKKAQFNSNHFAPYFAFLKKLTDVYGLKYCSMGMSDDYKIAIKFGATHLRIGSAIFKKGVLDNA